MKKIFTILMASLLMVSFVFVTGCKKDDEDNFTLNNTKWESVVGTVTYTLNFTSETNVNVSYINTSDNSSGSTIGTYTYTHPAITIIDDGETETGTVEGNTMTFTSGFIFTRI